jgi:hypothetical protein
MDNVIYLIFDTESELLEEVDEVRKVNPNHNIIALCPAGAYQVNLMFPNVSLEDFYYKIFIISYLNVWSVSYVHSEYEIAEGFPEEDRQRVFEVISRYYDETLNPHLWANDLLNRPLSPIPEQEKTEAVIAQPQPLLFSSSDPLSPIPRPTGVDVDLMAEELREAELNEDYAVSDDLRLTAWR